jgi:hypothetical protein
VWHKTAEQILERLAGYCAAINQDAGSKEPSADGASRKPITRRINRTAH